MGRSGVSIQGEYGDFVFLARPVDGGPVRGLQRVPEPRSGIEFTWIPAAARASLRCCASSDLGPGIVGEHEMPGLVRTVLADPEGNEFCVGEHTDSAGRDDGH